MRRYLPVVTAFALSISALGLYVGLAIARVGTLSFPLDDAWIHLTFARNLAMRGELSFVSGQPSAGSTSPLWSISLAPGFWFGNSPEFWALLLGAVLLAGSAWLAGRVAGQCFPEARWISTATMLVFPLEWHLAWSALSGMETLLFIFLLLLLLRLKQVSVSPVLLGLVSGLLVVTRPEGSLLVGMVVSSTLLRNRAARMSRISVLLLLALGMSIPLLPYLAFNWLVGGTPMPNTFHAKQAEYAPLLETPIWDRLWNVAAVPFVGAQILLVPGVVVSMWLAVRERRGDAVLLLAWWLALTLAYAVRLPVTYQHGRYEIPAIPALLIAGLWGTWRLSKRLSLLAISWARIMSQAWRISFALLLVVFWLRGAVAYAADAKAMDCIGVQTARWLREHTARQDRLAVHDIGAVGYLLPDRPLIDLAGLISPDVIGFIRDEPRLLAYLIEQDAAYLVTSEAWHPSILQDTRIRRVFQNDCAFVRSEGGYEIGVYAIGR